MPGEEKAKQTHTKSLYPFLPVSAFNNKHMHMHPHTHPDTYNYPTSYLQGHTHTHKELGVACHAAALSTKVREDKEE